MLKKILLVALLPVTMVIIILKPIIFLRIIRLPSKSYGHFLQETLLSLSYLEKYKTSWSLFNINLFFLSSKQIASQEILKLWRREIKIFPHLKLIDLIIFNLNYLIKSKIFSPKILWYKHLHLADKYEVKKFKFSNHEKFKLLSELEQNNINIKKQDKWICINNRDNAWTNLYFEKFENKSKQFNEKYLKGQQFRNNSIEKMGDAVNFFLDQGYIVFRTGKVSSEKLIINHKKYYDLTQIKCSEALQIYLLSNTQFFFGAEGGLRWLPRIFKRNISTINSPEIMTEILYSYNETFPFLPKKVFLKENKKLLTLKEIFDHQLYRRFPDWKINFSKISFEENSSEEILSLAREISYYHLDKMPLSKEDQSLKKRYFRIVNENCPRINNFNPQDNKLTISLNYLKKNEFLLN